MATQAMGSNGGGGLSGGKPGGSSIPSGSVSISDLIGPQGMKDYGATSPPSLGGGQGGGANGNNPYATGASNFLSNFANNVGGQLNSPTSPSRRPYGM
jgi:hypothetical protein